VQAAKRARITMMLTSFRIFIISSPILI